MNCKFNWHNLPNDIKSQIAEPLKEVISLDLYNKFQKLKWYNLPNDLNKLFKQILIEKEDCTNILYSDFIWYDLNRKVEVLCQIKDNILNCQSVEFLCEGSEFSSDLFEVNIQYDGVLTIPYNSDKNESYFYNTPIIVNGLSFLIGSGNFLEGGGNLEVQVSGLPITEGLFSVELLGCTIQFNVSSYNFDLNIDEATLFSNRGINNESTFIDFLETQGASDIVIDNFLLQDGRLRCNLSFNGTNSINFFSFGITKINNLSALINLTDLQFQINSIIKIENISNLTNLTSLSFDTNQISSIENLENLVNLTVLSLSNNQISTIEKLDELVNLQILDISLNNISTIENLNNLVNLQTLSLSSNNISVIENLTNQNSLVNLLLDSNNISLIQGLDNLTTLQVLSLNDNNISTIENLENLVSINTIGLLMNQITLIDNLETLTTLSTLYLDNNQITTLQNLDTLVNLAYLSISFNSLTLLNNIDTLTSLSYLNLTANQLTTSDFNVLNSWALSTVDDGEFNAESNVNNFDTSTTYTTLLGKNWTIIN